MFFDNFAAKHELRFLDDYVDMANLSSLATEHLGMIDVIVASRGRAFAGTFYSTFSGYITRLRGYYGMSKYSTFYSWNPKKYEMQNGDFFAPSNEFNREYAIGWIAIDGDEKVFGDHVKEENIGDGKAAASGGEITADTKDTTKLIATDGANNVKNSTVRRKHRASLTSTFFSLFLSLANCDLTTFNLLCITQILFGGSKGGKRGGSNGSKVAYSKGQKPMTVANVSVHGIRSLEETIISTLGFLPNEDGEMEVASDGTTLYIVFSTDCEQHQHWQSYLLFFSAMRVRQLGFITRIASGCTDKQQQETREWHQEVNSKCDCVACFH
jgi:hypothetical protein